MNNNTNDLSVLLIFFARPNTLKEVFEQVKKAKPARLFLACDGPRKDNEQDIINTQKCKEIVSQVDWDCEVYTLYHQENQGCGMGPYKAISWAFEHTDKLIILEDDCVPAPSFFPYMQELLEKYKDDQRIGLVSGFNHLKEWETGGNSYFFTKTGATLGWGTWKRVWDNYDFYVKDAQDEYVKRLLLCQFDREYVGKKRIGDWKKANRETNTKKVDYWDYQFGFLKYTQSQFSIVPKTNLIYNIGVGQGSTHTEKNGVEPWKKGKILFMPTQDLNMPLCHPKYIMCDSEYDNKVFKIVYKTRFQKLINKIKRLFK